MSARRVSIVRELEERLRTVSPRLDVRSWYHKLPRALARGLSMEEAPTTKEVVFQARLLCQEYTHNRLQRHGLKTTKVNLLRLPTSSKLSEASKEIILIGCELERMYPSVYNNVARQLLLTIQSAKSVCQTLEDVSRAMFDGYSVTWPRIVSLFGVTAALACDCVQQGHPDFVDSLLDVFCQIVSSLVAPWIVEQGGWKDVVGVYRGDKKTAALLAVTVLGAVVAVLSTVLAVYNR